MSFEPDYENYSFQELVDVYENIDRNQFPERFYKVAKLLGKDIRAQVVASEIDAFGEEVVGVDPELAEIIKAKRINDYFDSLSEDGSEFYSGDAGSGTHADGGSSD